MTEHNYGYKQWLGILPGWDWLKDHGHDYDDWKPTFEIIRPGFKSTTIIYDRRVINEVIKAVVK